MKTRRKAEAIAPAPAQASFTDGSERKGQRISFAGYSFSPGAYSGYGGNGSLYNPAHRDRSLAASYASESIVQNPTIATIVHEATISAVGCGLALDACIDGAAVGISEEEARTLNETIEKRWAAWATDPLECDLSGRFDIHSLAALAYVSFLTTGEVLTTLDWRRTSDAETGTKVALLAPAMIDMRTQSEDSGRHTYQGVSFDSRGRIDALWLRRSTLGDTFQAATSERYSVQTLWGRPKIHFGFEPIYAGQVRGISPIVAAFAPAQDKNMLSELQVCSAAIQSSYAVTIESALPPAAAFGALAVAEDNGGYDPLALKTQWYEKSPVQLRPGVISHLSPGDQLKYNTAQISTAYEAFNDSLVREAARAAGLAVESVAGDFSKTSFSASRLALAGPHRLTLRRRRMIAETFYRSIYAAFLEEQIERGMIALPAHAKPFWQARAAYLKSEWIGPGKISADPKKDAETTLMELNGGLTTYSAALAERGTTIEAMIAKRKEEQRMLEESGLLGKSIFVGKVSTQITVDEEEVEGKPKGADDGEDKGTDE